MSSGEYERLAGRYRVVKQLGRGGMGVVWRAVDEVLGREVAVKELRAYNDSSGPELADLRLRMQREARAAARVRHPGVISVHDVTEHEGRPVIVMELVDGPSLDDVLGERGVLDPQEAAGIGAAVLEALAAAHDVGVLHRDVKPGNVLLDRGGRVVLTDFGIATMDDPGDGSATHLTRSGEIVGSLDYLAPERAQGRQPGPASDVWALGATLYAAVEGASPFRRTSTWSTLNAIVVEPLPEPRRAGALGPVLLRLMDKDPDRRPDARSAARLLATVAEGREAVRGAAPGGAFAPGAGETGGRFGPAVTETGGGFGPAVTETGGGFGPAVTETGGGFGPAGSVPPYVSPPQGAQIPPVPPVAQAPHAPGVASPAFPPGASAAVPTAPTRARAKKRPTALIAATVAAVLLAGGGVTYAFVGRDGDTGQGRLAGGEASAGSPEDPGRVLEPGSLAPSASGSTPGATPSKPGGGASAAASPSSSSSSSSSSSKAPVPGTGGTGADGGTATGGGATGGGGTDGGGTTGGATGGGGTTTSGGGTGTTGGGTTEGPAPTTGAPAPQPDPVCHARGDGKYDCQVWRTEKTYSHGGGEVGVLNAGTNYFYCQTDLGRRETYGQWTNVWWARTDDDSGNTNVYFSVVYVKGGDNDRPLPGLPLC